MEFVMESTEEHLEEQEVTVWCISDGLLLLNYINRCALSSHQLPKNLSREHFVLLANVPVAAQIMSLHQVSGGRVPFLVIETLLINLLLSKVAAPPLLPPPAAPPLPVPPPAAAPSPLPPAAAPPAEMFK